MSSPAKPRSALNLQHFVPYRLALAAEAVSRALAQVYAERFDLTRDEWRLIAQLSAAGELKAADLGARASLSKMQVSRAATRLAGAGLIVRAVDPEDRRNLVLRLTDAGQALFRKLEPVVLAREADLLDGLAAEERDALARALVKLEARAARLAARH